MFSRMPGLSKLLHIFDTIFHILNRPLSFLLLDTSLSPAGTLGQAGYQHLCACLFLPSLFLPVHEEKEQYV